MSLRKTINEKTPLIAAAVVLAICTAGWATYYQLKPPARPPIPTGVWFIPEDKTAFEDCIAMPLDTITPTKHEGKTLVKAHVLEINGQKRVLYMKKLTDKAAKDIAARKGRGSMPVQTEIDMSVGSLLVKRPGDRLWSAMMSKEGSAIIREAASMKGEGVTPTP